VLDEATSALDSLTEKQIQVGYFDLIKIKPRLSMRSSTVHHLKDGSHCRSGKSSIIEQGTHQPIAGAKKGKYYAMWQHQSGDFLVD